jgi:hypothetical protein
LKWIWFERRWFGSADAGQKFAQFATIISSRLRRRLMVIGRLFAPMLPAAAVRSPFPSLVFVESTRSSHAVIVGQHL